MFLATLKFSVSVVLTCYYFFNELEWHYSRGHADNLEAHHEEVMSDFPHLHHVDGIKGPHSNIMLVILDNFGHSQHQFCQLTICSYPVSIRIYSGTLVS